MTSEENLNNESSGEINRSINVKMNKETLKSLLENFYDVRGRLLSSAEK